MAKQEGDLPKRKPPAMPPRPPSGAPRPPGQGGPEARRPKPPPPPPRDDDDDDDDDQDRPPGKKRGRGAMATVIPYHNPPALVGYYCGFLALIAVLVAVVLIKAYGAEGVKWFSLLGYGGGGLFSLLAMGLGVWGFIVVGQQPKAKGTGHALFAVFLGVVVLLALIGLVMMGGVDYLQKLLS